MPVSTFGLVVLLIVLAFVLGAYRIIRTVKPFIVNAVVGLLVLLLLNWAGVGVEITPLVVLVVAVGGVPGAILVAILAYVGVFFAPVPLV